MNSTFKADLDRLFMILFEWLDREVTALMLVGVAAILLLLGVFYVFSKPRGLGVLLVTVHGLAWIPIVVMWYDRLPYLKTWQPLLAIVVIYAFIVSALSFGSTRRVSIKRYNVSRAMMLIGQAYFFFGVAFVLEGYYIVTYDDVTGPADSWYILKFIRALIIVLGVLYAVFGAISGVLLRALVHRRPHRTRELP